MSLVMVPFRGDGDGVGELTWSQANLWQGMTVGGPPITLGGKVAPHVPMTVDDVVDMVRFTVSRHQALRTKLKLRGDKPPLQVCVSSGEMPLEVIDAGDGDPDALVREVEKRYRNTPFDYENEFPVRTAVVHRDGTAHWVVTIYLHLAMDTAALTALADDVLKRDPVTGEAGPVTSIQPLELAAKQQQPPAQRKSAAAMAYLEQVLRVMPLRQFGEPRYPDTGPRILKLRSRAAALAIQRIAARESTSTSSAVLAAFAVGVTRYTGHPNVMAMLLVSNRFRPGLADAVSPVVQMSPCLIDVAGATLRDAVIRTGSSVLTAYKHAYYDPYEQDVVYERVEAERGQLEYWQYNDVRDMDRSASMSGPTPTDDEIRAALGSTEHRWVPTKSTSPGLYLTVMDGPDDTIEFELMAESRFLSENDMVGLTTEIETAAVRTALEPDLPTDFPADAPRSGAADAEREVMHHA